MTVTAPPSRRAFTEKIEVHVARSPEEFAQVTSIREIVFRDEQGIVDAAVTDSEDRPSVHVYATIDGTMVGIGRLTPPTIKRPEGQVAWVATLPESRRRGVGAAIMRTLMEIADQYHVRNVLLSAQTHALPFYVQFGFVPYGKRFEVRGIEHQFMERVRPD